MPEANLFEALLASSMMISTADGEFMVTWWMNAGLPVRRSLEPGLPDRTSLHTPCIMSERGPSICHLPT